MVVGKVLGVLLAVDVLVIGIFNNNLVKVYGANSGSCGENVSWNLDVAGTLNIAGMGNMANYENTGGISSSPWCQDDKSVYTVNVEEGVTSIGSYAFYYWNGGSGFKSKLTEVNFPSTLKSIEESAFEGCYLLSKLRIPSSVTSIEKNAFSFCKALTEVTLPSGISVINRGSFYDCENLMEVTIPSGVTQIGLLSFAYCKKLKTVNIPLSVESISEGAFFECSNISDVYYEGTELEWEVLKNKATQAGSNNCLTGATVHYSASVYRDKKYSFLDSIYRLSGICFKSFKKLYPESYLEAYTYNESRAITSELDYQIAFSCEDWTVKDDDKGVKFVGSVSAMIQDYSDSFLPEEFAMSITPNGGMQPLCEIQNSGGTVHYISNEKYAYISFDSDGDGELDSSVYVDLDNSDYITAESLIWFFPKQEYGENEASIIEAVSRYTNDEELHDILDIFNGNYSDEVKRKKLLEYYHYDNMLDVGDRIHFISETRNERMSYFGLTMDEMYGAWQWYDYLNNTAKGKAIKAALYAGGLVFNDELDSWLDPSTYIDGTYPGVEKYKSMLKEFITYQSEEIELVSYIMQTEKLINSSVGLCTAVEKGEIISKLSKTKNITSCKSAFNDFIASKNYDGKTVEIKYEKKTPFTEAMGMVDTAFKISKIGVNGLNDFLEVTTNIELYQMYHEFLYNEIYLSNDLPVELRLAAYQLDEEMAQTYWTPVKNLLNEIRNECFDEALHAVNLKSLSDLIDAGGYWKAIKYTSFCINQFVNVGDMIVNSAQTEGYVYLTNHYRDKLISCKQAFLDDKTEENAWKFYETYNILWKLRIAGEEKFLAMNRLEGGKIVDNMQESITGGKTLAQIISDAYGYKDKEAIISDNLKIINNFKFSFDKKSSSTENLYAKKAVIACPVDVEFFLGDKSIIMRDGQACDFVNDTGRFVSFYRATEGEWVKIAYFVNDEPFHIKVSGKNDGNVTYTLVVAKGSDELTVCGFDNMRIGLGSVIEIDADNSTYYFDDNGDGKDVIQAEIVDKLKKYVQFDYQNNKYIKIRYVDQNGFISKPDDPILDGYEFIGWFTEKNGEGSQFDLSRRIDESMTVYAYWKAVEKTEPDNPSQPDNPPQEPVNPPSTEKPPAEEKQLPFDFTQYHHVTVEQAISSNGCIIARKGKLDVAAYIPGATRFISSDRKVASVSRKRGLVRGKRMGETVITGQVKSGKIWVDVGTYTVYVVEPEIDKDMIYVLPARGYLKVGDAIKNDTLIPSKLESSKSSVVVIDEKRDMLKVGYEYGSSTITAYYGEGKNAAKYRFSVRVKKGDKLNDPTIEFTSKE